MKKFDYIFLSLAKDVEKTIPIFLDFINKISKNHRVLVCIGEDGSKDNTLEIINKYKRKLNNLIIIKTDKINKINNRIQKIAAGRQILKDYIIKNKFYAKFVVITDLDDVLKNGLNIKSFKQALHILQINKNKIFGISAKSKPYYYDMLNLKIPNLYNFNIYKIQCEKNFDFYNKRKKYIYDYQFKISKMKDLLTISSFNGFCIYFFDDYKNSNYISKNKKKIIPEHLYFNNNIYKKSKKFILMSNAIILNTPQEHFPYNYFLHFVFKKIINFIKYNAIK
jgi:glycosyltransferase involved in cell wall biosynthesis